MSLSSSASRDIRFAYPLALALAASPMLELAARLWPLKPYLVQWRFQAEVALINLAPVFMIGMAIWVAVAWASESVRMQRLASLILALFGLALLPALVMLALDMTQVLQIANSNIREGLRNNTIVSGLKGILAAFAALSLAFAAWRLASDIEEEVPSRRPGSGRPDDDGDLLLVTDTRD